MITLKISDLLNATETLQSLSQKSLKAKLAFSVAKLLKGAEAEIQQFNDTRMKIITKYGEKDENGELKTDEKGNCKIAQETVNEFSSELTELLQTEVEINANKLSMNDLENIEFTPNEMVLLEPFMDMDEE